MAFSCGTVEQENAVRARKVFWRYPVAKHTSGSQTCPVEFLIGSLAAADLLFQTVRVQQRRGAPLLACSPTAMMLPLPNNAIQKMESWF